MGEEHQKISEIQVSEFMVKEPFFITPNEKISSTELLMLRKNIGALPVVRNSKDKQIIGIITQRDIRLARFAMALDTPNTRVKDLMTPDPITVKINNTLPQTLEKMIKNHVERLPVVNDNQELVGLVTKQSLIERIFLFFKE